MIDERKQAMKWPQEQRDAFWDGFVTGIQVFERDYCLQVANSECPYLEAKVANRIEVIGMGDYVNEERSGK